jgi:hypothetical protein
MGFDLATIQFLTRWKDLGISLDRVLTLGRQWMYVKPEEVRSVLANNGIRISLASVEELFADKGYCEPLLKLLGANQIESMDVSAYENATILQDLNQPWPAELLGRYSLIVDGGTLEHVFHFPTALRSVMQAIRTGGHFLSITPANNLMGHGFYQFSPELFYRVFTAENGFAVEKMLLYEQPWKSVWYEVADPSVLRARVELVNRNPAYLIVCAKKISSAGLSRIPVQSDYPLLYWQQSAGAETAKMKPPPSVSFFKRHAPEWLGHLYRRLRPFRAPYFIKAR